MNTPVNYWAPSSEAAENAQSLRAPEVLEPASRPLDFRRPIIDFYPAIKKRGRILGRGGAF